MYMYDFQRLKNWMDNVCAKGAAPGCDVLIYREHEQIFRYITGTADLEKTKPLTDKAAYYLYSCSKPITVTGAMLLVQRGQLELDAPVGNYLPAFRDAFVVENGEKICVGEEMTVRHLFTMSAGLDYQLDRPAVRALLARKPDASTSEVVSAFAQDPLLFRPGERYEYSLCHDVLGAVIESVSGMRFGDFLRENIFAPLGMEHTYFAKKGEVPDNMVEQYRYWGENGMDQVDGNGNVFLFNRDYQSGGAGLISTTEDYARFADAMACGGCGANGARILEEKTVEQMRTEQLHKLLKNPAFCCSAGPGYSYGLGVRVLTDRSDGQRSSLGEFGWDGAAGAYLLCDPQTHLSIVYMQHVQNWPDPLEMHAPVRDLTYDIMDL